MTCRRPCRRSVSSFPFFLTTIKNRTKHAAALVVVLLATLTVVAQDQPQTGEQPGAQPMQTQADAQSATVTLPAGTRLPLVLTHPIQSRYIHRGDDIYAQTTAPVTSGNQVVIPPGTFVQGTVDSLGRNGSRGELRLQSMSITFPDGYVVPISGPITLESNEGYALKDPGQKRFGGAIIMPLAGVGLGALIGHSVGSSQSIMTTTLPPGCVGPPPGCLSSSMTVAGSKFKDTGIGAGIGGAIGMFASIAVLVSSHHFYIDVGAPIEMTLQQPVSLPQNEVTAAVRESAEHPVPEQPIAPRPVYPAPPPDSPIDHGTCYTPGTPGTPPTVIPGVPGPDGIPGPPTIIPGTPPTPGMPYPCP
jgi:hypothetical protein